MIINYLEKHIWRKDAVSEPEQLYGKKNSKRIRSILPRVDSQDIRFEFLPLDGSFLGWFTPFYKEHIGSKKNAQIHDLYAQTLGKAEHVYEYWSLTIFEKDKPVGGSIIFTNNELLMLAYRAFLPKWEFGSLQASPSLYADYITSKIAFETGKRQVSHGKDRNLYGINSSIGQAIYKLSVGYIPQIPKPKENEVSTILTIDTDDIMVDSLLFHLPEKGERITHATLLTHRASEQDYMQMRQYPDLIKVDTVFID
jgi:hypothetical protein